MTCKTFAATSLATIAAATLGASAISAQSTVVVPAIAEFEEGNDISDPRFLEQSSFRAQHLVDGQSIAPNNAVITTLGFRADNDNSIGASAATINNVTIEMSTTMTTPDAMSATFATNITGTPMLVFTGSISIPAYASSTGGIAPWFTVTLDTPFVLNTNENLLIDMVANDVGTLPNVAIDCCLPGGVHRRVGQTGPNNNNLFLNAAGNSLGGNSGGRFAGMVPGDGFALRATGNAAVSGFWGLGFTRFDPGLDLSVIMAPGNELYTDPVISIPMTLQPPFIGFDFSERLDLFVPNDPNVSLTNLYAQCFFSVPAANPLGLVTTNLRTMTIGEGFNGSHPCNQLSSSDPLDPGGFLRYGSSNITGAAPIQFGGSFN